MYENYERLRNALGVRDSDVSKATGIHPSTFSDWKKGKSSPKIQKLQLLADYFGVDVLELSKDSSDEPDTIKTKEPIKTDETKDYGIIGIDAQIYLRNELLHRLLLAGGKVFEYDPKVIEAMVYALENMGDKK